MVRRRTSRPRRKLLRRRAYKKRTNIRSVSQTFSEILQAGDIAQNSGGVFKVRMLDVPQVSAYATLYNQFAIKKLEVTIMPRLTEFPLDTQASIPSVGSSLWVPRLAYSVSDTPDVQVPTNELSVLTDNGAKLRQMDKPIKLTCYPKPDVGVTDLLNNTTVALRTKKLQWLNFKNTETASDGISVPHGGIRFWISGQPIYQQQSMFNVYYKVTFSVRDPA